MKLLLLFLALLQHKDPFESDPLIDANDQIKLLCSTFGIPIGAANVRATCLMNPQTGEKKFSLAIDESLLPAETRTVRCVLVYWDDTDINNQHTVTVETQPMFVPDDKPDKKKKKGESGARQNSLLETDEYIFPVKSLLSIEMFCLKANGKTIGSPNVTQFGAKPAVPSSDGAVAPDRKNYPPIRP